MFSISKEDYKQLQTKLCQDATGYKPTIVKPKCQNAGARALVSKYSDIK